MPSFIIVGCVADLEFKSVCMCVCVRGGGGGGGRERGR